MSVQTPVVAETTPDTLTLRDAARIAGYTYEPFRRIVADRREIPAIRVRGQWRIARADLDAWMTAESVTPRTETVTETVEEWAQRIAADAPPMTTDQAQYVMSALRTASPALAAAQGGAAA